MIAAIWSVLVSLAPSLLLGAAIAGLLHVLLPPDFLTRHMQGRSGVAKSVLLGVPLPLCSCGVLPAGLGLKKDGASDGATVGFLISTPQTGVDSILVSASFLGWPFALFKVVSAAVTGVVGGLLADAVADDSETEDQTDTSCAVAGNRSLRGAIDQGIDLLRMIWRWLVVGVLISAAIEVWVPDAVFARFADLGAVGAAFAALAVSLPLYVCATASVPIAAALVAGGMPAGAALVFLMAGPATNAATVGALYRALGARLLAVYLAVIIVGSIGFSLAFDFLLGPQTVAHVGHEHGASWWEIGLAGLLVTLLTWFLAQDVRRWWRRRDTSGPADAPPIEVSVEGMRCNGCVRHLEETLLASDRIETADVSLEPARAVVHGPASESEVRELVASAGYRAAS